MKANQLTNREIDSFSTQMALVLHAGISAYEGIAIMNEDAGSEELKPVLADIYKHLENGESFHDALAATSAFPDYFLKMVQIGEMSGRLDEVMESLSVHYRRMHYIQSGVQPTWKFYNGFFKDGFRSWNDTFKLLLYIHRHNSCNYDFVLVLY